MNTDRHVRLPRSVMLLIMSSLVWLSSAGASPLPRIPMHASQPTTASAGSQSVEPTTACSGTQCVYLPAISRPEDVRFVISRPFTLWRGGCWEVAGHVEATGGRPVYDVVIEVVFGEPGNPVTRTLSPALPATFPGEPNPFNINVPNCRSEVVKATIKSYSLTSAVDYRPVTVVEQHIRALGYGRYEVTGTVRNDEATPITAIQVIAITGHVWSASLGASTLQPGATTTFSINMAFDLPDYYGPPPDYRLMAQGIRNP